VITQEDIGKHCINISDGRRLLNEIDKLTRELAEARAACATTEIWLRMLIGCKPVDVSAMKNALAGGTCRGELMKHGQSLLDELARLRRLEAAAEDDELACYIATEHVCRPTSCSAIETYRAALRKRMKGE
jgi:hypothetical protein